MKRITRRGFEDSFAAIKHPRVAPPAYPIEPHKTYSPLNISSEQVHVKWRERRLTCETTVQPLGNFVCMIPNEEVPVSATMISSS